MVENQPERGRCHVQADPGSDRPQRSGARQARDRHGGDDGAAIRRHDPAGQRAAADAGDAGRIRAAGFRGRSSASPPRTRSPSSPRRPASSRRGCRRRCARAASTRRSSKRRKHQGRPHRHELAPAAAPRACAPISSARTPATWCATPSARCWWCETDDRHVETDTVGATLVLRFRSSHQSRRVRLRLRIKACNSTILVRYARIARN